MVIYVDIDGTICTQRGPEDYHNAQPIFENISKINLLYEAGHDIIYWTARGSKTGAHWRSITECQLERWGCKYTKLKMGKPFYDLFIDDKTLRIEEVDDVIHTGNG